MTKKSPKLILLRHGQSVWNKENLFTGWVDIPLSEEGMQEAIAAGKKMENIPIDIVFTSTLTRAQMTVPLALLHHKSGKIPLFLHPGEGKREEWGQIYSEETKKKMIPVYIAWELNERMYGKLQGLNKAETAAQFGAEQVHLWRRSFDTKPPEGESLAMTAARAIPYFQKKILPHLEKGDSVLIAAHGNSLRAIAMHLENLSKEEVVQLELATGEPLIYSLQNGHWKR
jgi:2,3-bisphosphoglycerate-dependent phosphoglycerate mutase